jgi:CrcB protein
MTIFYIALGGGIGAVLRHLLTSKASHIFGVAFPYGTIIVNIIGSCLMGILIGYLAKTLPHSMELRAFLAIGLLGGFTTFSAFSLDAVNMIERGQLSQAAIYVALSVFVSIVALFAGLYVMRHI